MKADREKFNSVLDKHCEGSEYGKKIAHVLASDEKASAVLYGIISTSPLQLNRLFGLHKLAQDPKLIMRKILSHEDRLSWQIHRIYRERNQIVHSGTASPFLIPLVENSFLYFRTLAARLEAVYSRYGVIDPHGALQLLRGNQIEQKNILTLLADNGSKTSIDVRRKESIRLLFS